MCLSQVLQNVLLAFYIPVVIELIVITILSSIQGYCVSRLAANVTECLTKIIKLNFSWSKDKNVSFSNVFLSRNEDISYVAYRDVEL